MAGDSPNKGRFFSINNIFLALCFILFSVFLINTFQMEDASSYVLPRMLCIFGLVVILIMVVSAVFQKKTTQTDKPGGESGKKEGLAIGYSIAFAAAYFFMTNVLGFMLTTCLAIIAFSFIMGYQNKKIIILLSMIIPLILHLAFVTLLKASLPQGIVENLLFQLTG